MTPPEVEHEAEAIDLLRERGYLVVKIPPCNRQGRGHGRHTLITRSALCDGEEPMPHGMQNMHYGTFGPWYYCSCGHSFRDYHGDENNDEPTPWDVHKAEFIDKAKALDSGESDVKHRKEDDVRS